MKKNEMYFYQLLRDFLNDYLITRRNFSDKTVRAYRQSLNQLRIYLRDEKEICFEAMDFSCFSRDYIYEFLVWLRDSRKCSNQTLNLRLSAIKSFLKYCSEEDLVLMPIYLNVASIHAFKGTKKTCIEYLNPQQLKQLFAAPDITTKLGRRDRFFLIFTYETGARLQELLDIKLNCIICNDKIVKVRIYGKGSKIRYVPLMKSTVEHLEAYLSEFHKSSRGEDFLFYTIHDSKHTQMKPGTVDYFMKKYSNIAHTLDDHFPLGLHTHMLRHSIAMAMHNKGIPISYIKDFLGHSSLETTAIYSYANEETIAEALELVDHESYITDKNTHIKKWKNKEQYLMEYCSLL
jgi:site-specific recombinase XerD